MTAQSPLNVPVPSIQELAQNAARLLQQRLADAAQVARPADLGTADLELARSTVLALALVQAVGVHGAYRYLRDFVARQAVPNKATAEFLDDWLASYGMVRLGAEAATGMVRGSGVNASILPANTLLQTSDGRQYRTAADAVVTSGVVEASAIALVAGEAANVGDGTALQLVSPVSGIDSAFTAPGGISGGAEAESDEAAAYRLQQRLSAAPMGGSPADYARWALSVPGITRAWGVRNPAGPTSAGVIVMADGNDDGLPTSGQLAAVMDYIRDPRRGPPDELFVGAPVLVPVPFVIHMSPDNAAVRAGVVAALRDLFAREAYPGGSIPHAHAVEAISAVVGEYNHTISTPAIESGGFFTVPAYNRLLVLGSVVFS